MSKELEVALRGLSEEIKKDIYFFGLTGAIVALLMVWQERFKELGIAKTPHWANDLFSDLMSVNAFGFIFFGYLIISCLANIADKAGHPSSKLENMVIHLEMRFSQMASAIISFLIGFTGFIILYSFIDFDLSGLKLIGLIIGLSFFIIGSYMCAVMVGRRTEPWNNLWVSVLSLMALGLDLWWLLIQNAK